MKGPVPLGFSVHSVLEKQVESPTSRRSTTNAVG